MSDAGIPCMWMRGGTSKGGFFLAADLPDDIAKAWGGWMATATSNKEFVEKMEARGSVIRLMDPVESKKFIEAQYNQFKALVDELGMRVEG